MRPATLGDRDRTTREDELVTAFNLLIHDLRAPLSVAHGYLRLLRDDRLASPDDRNRALAQTSEALGRLSTLCAEASSFIGTYDSAPDQGPSVPARDLVRRLQHASGPHPVSLVDVPDEDRVLRAASLDRLVDAVHRIVACIGREGAPATAQLTVAAIGSEIVILFGTAEHRDTLVKAPRAALDPLRRGHGLALPLACRTVERTGGVVWTIEGTRGAVGIALPLES
jgi:hypothetical protein